MAIYPGIRIVQWCDPNALSGGAANPWRAEIDAGHVHVMSGKNPGKTTLQAATLAALNTAIKVQTDALGIT